MIKEQEKGGSSHNILARKRILNKNRHYKYFPLNTLQIVYIIFWARKGRISDKKFHHKIMSLQTYYVKRI